MRVEWKDIPGYEGMYQASSLGEIRSIPHIVHGRNWQKPDGFTYMVKGRVLKQRKKNNGYLQVILFSNGNSKSFLVHRLVAAAFFGASDLTVNHKNEIKTDNRVSNLEYLTQAENTRYSQAIPLESYDLKTGETVKRYEAGTDVAKDGHDVQAVNHCCRKAPRYKSHHGLGWRFVNVSSA